MEVVIGKGAEIFRMRARLRIWCGLKMRVENAEGR